MTVVSAVRPDSPELAEVCASGLGAYIHVPFCEKKCAYCDFASYDGLMKLAERYVDAVLGEISGANLGACDTLYVGGGTPTVLPPRLLARLISAVELAEGAEVTVEANPESLDGQTASAIAEAGGNRISIGMQSSVPRVLEALGRSHTPDAVGAAVRTARAAGIGRINLDLIYGTPGESVSDWRSSIETALAYEPEHVSAYALTLEAGTPMARAAASGGSTRIDEDDQADKMNLADEVLSDAGFIRYEVAAWARAGQACRHNLLYWGCGQYRGFGSGAHSHVDGHRFWNASRPDAYMAGRVSRPKCGEVITDQIAYFDRVSLGMRRAAGIRVAELPDAAIAVASELAHAGLVYVDDGRLRPTRRGFALGNEVASRLLSVSEVEC